MSTMTLPKRSFLALSAIGWADGSLNRKDWGLTWNQVLDAGGFALADKIELHIEVEATKAA